MTKTLIELFEACLEALAHGDREKLYDATADMHLAIGYDHAPEPSFGRLLAAIENTNIPTAEEQVEYEATRITEIAERRAREFRKEWGPEWESVGAETLAQEFREVVEDVIGEPRQEPRPKRGFETSRSAPSGRGDPKTGPTVASS